MLACRSVERGEAAKADIQASIESSIGASKKGNGDEKKTAIEVWQVDLTSFESVRAFCRRADEQLDRLDAVVENAGLARPDYVEADGGHESTVAVNVVSTFLMALLLFPLLRRTAGRFNVRPRLVVVSSDAHYFVRTCPFFLPSLVHHLER